MHFVVLENIALCSIMGKRHSKVLSKRYLKNGSVQRMEDLVKGLLSQEKENFHLLFEDKDQIAHWHETQSCNTRKGKFHRVVKRGRSQDRI